MLDMLGNSRLETIVVGAGPGSYGGIRVALAAADGISLIHGCRVVSLCSWEALPVSDAVTCHVISDARRNGWAVASFKDRRQKGDITILSTGELIKVIPVWQQQNETVYSPETAELLSTLEISGIVAEQVPEARLLGKAWLKRNASERQTLLEHNPSPIYVRPPHITEAKRPAWATRKQ